MVKAEYCLECSWIFDKMGACKPPSALSIFSYISFVPYLIIIFFVIATLFTRNRQQLKMSILLLSAYILADRVLKNLIQSPRPEGACKSSFGFPSSHMVVMCCYTFQIWQYGKQGQQIFLLILIILQAFARTQLNYHTWQQVIGGVVYAIIFTLLFQTIYSKVMEMQKVQSLCQFLGIRQMKQGKNKQ